MRETGQPSDYYCRIAMLYEPLRAIGDVEGNMYCNGGMTVLLHRKASPFHRLSQGIGVCTVHPQTSQSSLAFIGVFDGVDLDCRKRSCYNNWGRHRNSMLFFPLWRLVEASNRQFSDSIQDDTYSRFYPAARAFWMLSRCLHWTWRGSPWCLFGLSNSNWASVRSLWTPGGVKCSWLGGYTNKKRVSRLVTGSWMAVVVVSPRSS